MKKIANNILTLCIGTLCLAVVSHAQPADTAKPPSVYDEKVYNLAYKTFLANGNIKDAYALAREAVKHNPNDLLWRKRLAQVARWYSKPKESLKHWSFLAIKYHDKQAWQEASELARSLNNWYSQRRLWLYKLAHNPNDVRARQELAHIEQKIGEPKVALNHLQNTLDDTTSKEHRIHTLTRIARLQLQLGNYKAATKTLHRLSALGHYDHVFIKELVTITVRQGQFQEAVSLLKEANAHDPRFTSSLAHTAWLANDMITAFNALKQLRAQNKLTVTDSYRLLNLYRDFSPKDAFPFAKYAWQKYKTNYLFLQLLDIGHREERWQELDKLMRHSHKLKNRRIYTSAYFYLIKAQTEHALGRNADPIYQAGLKRYPSNNDLIIGYVWYLIEKKDSAALKTWLHYNEHIAKKNPKLKVAYPQMLIIIGEKQKALAWLNRLYPKHRNDPVWLADYASLLADEKEKYKADIAKHRAWALLQKKLSKSYQASLSKQYQQTLAALSLSLAPGDTALNALTLLAKNKSSDADELWLAWAISHRHYDLAFKMRNILKAQGKKIPAWAALSLSLVEHDTVASKRLLARPQKLRNVSASDQMNAYLQTGDWQEARDVGRCALAKDPHNADVYATLLDIMRNYADRFSIEQTQRQFGRVRGPETLIKGWFSVSEHWFMSFDANVWLLSTIDDTFIRQLPKYDNAYHAGLHRHLRRGWINMKVWYRRAVEMFWGGSAELDYRVTSKLKSNLLIAFNQVSNDNTPLRIGGVRDYGELQLSYRVTDRDETSLLLAGVTLRDQERHKINDGYGIAAEWQHRWFRAYPDYTTFVFASHYEYFIYPLTQSSSFRLLPLGEPRSAAYFDPETFSEAGIGMSVGEQYRLHYSEHFRPFAVASILYNTVSKLGGVAMIGFATPVFGRDHLAISAQAATQATENDAIDWLLSLRYQVYLK